MQITYLNGDATRPTGTGIKIITHICNDIGAWGAGFVMAISRRWPIAKEKYVSWAQYGRDGPNEFILGNVQFVNVASDVIIANMIGQHGVGKYYGDIPLRYDAVQKCLERIRDKAMELNASIHMPRIGCGLAGGKWNEIEKIINKVFSKTNIQIFVYDL